MKKLAKYIALVITALFVIGCSNAVESVSENKIDLLPPTTIADPPAGTYSEKQYVTLICSDNMSGCNSDEFYFSIDPSQIADQFPLYRGETIPVFESMTLRFYSIDYDGNTENIVSQKYVIDYPPLVVEGKLSFSLSDNTMGISWETAIDQISQLNLVYQVFYAETYMVTVDDTLSIGTAFNTWQSERNILINTQNLLNAKDYIWQVLVKDTFGNMASYSASKLSLDSAIVPTVYISNTLDSDMLAASKLNTGILKAYIAIDNGAKQEMHK